MVKNKGTLTYDIGISKQETEFLELVGIEIYSEYGYDRYDYSKNSMPVNIPLIKRDYEKAKELGFITNGDCVETVALEIVEMYESEYDE